MKLTLIGKRPETDDVESFIFKPETPITWKAGQFLHYTLPHENPDSRKTDRYFTNSAAPFEDHVMITTRFAEKSSSFKSALREMPIGGTIDAEEPDGEFVIEDPARKFVFIAGGIGITPFRSILLDLDHRNISINAILLYANRDERIVFKKELEALLPRHKNFSIKYFIDPQRIDEASVAALNLDLQQDVFYISGPEPMVQAFEKMLGGMGVPEKNMVRDYFPGYEHI